MGKRQKNVLHDSAGKKIMHPADAERRKKKQQVRERITKQRKKNFEQKLLEKSPELIEAEIRDYQDMDAAGKLTKIKKDRLTRELTAYQKLKGQVNEQHQKRIEAQKADPHFVDFDELKIHRKASIYYDPVKNPWGAPPNGSPVLYRHPDGSVKRSPPPLEAEGARVSGDAGIRAGEDSEDESGSDSDSEMGGGGGGAASSSAIGPSLPPGGIGPSMPPSGAFPSQSSGMPAFPPGMPPLPPGMPPLPPGMPPLPLGMPPLPPGMPPLPPGMPPLPPLPPGMPPLPAGLPPPGAFPPGFPPGFPADGSIPPGFPPGFPGGPPAAGFPPIPFKAPPPGGPPGPPRLVMPPGPQLVLPPGMAPPNMSPPSMAPPGTAPGPAELGTVPGGAPSPFASLGPGWSVAGGPPAGGLVPPGPPPKGKGKGKGMPAGPMVSDLPAGVKAPPPPKKASAPAPGDKAAPKAAMLFMPTTLRTKKPSQVAGGVLQVSASSLSYEARKKVLFTEKPRAAERVNLDEAFEEFLKETS